MIRNKEQLQQLSLSEHFVRWMGEHWMIAVNILMGLFVFTPFLAPVFMKIGWQNPARAIYWFYSFLCHQLPERSYFLFGPKISYSIPEIQSVWHNSSDIFILRGFTGNELMGWKVAWSDRMVSMYGGIWFFGLVWGLFRKKIKPLPWWGLFLLVLPMAVDGSSHFISDLSGIGQGFRYTNTWLAMLTHNYFPALFYTGDARGSVNAWLRLISGLLFALGLVWFGYNYLDEAFKSSAEIVDYRLQSRMLIKEAQRRV